LIKLISPAEKTSVIVLFIVYWRKTVKEDGMHTYSECY